MLNMSLCNAFFLPGVWNSLIQLICSFICSFIQQVTYIIQIYLLRAYHVQSMMYIFEDTKINKAREFSQGKSHLGETFKFRIITGKCNKS